MAETRKTKIAGVASVGGRPYVAVDDAGTKKLVIVNGEYIALDPTPFKGEKGDQGPRGFPGTGGGGGGGTSIVFYNGAFKTSWKMTIDTILSGHINNAGDQIRITKDGRDYFGFFIDGTKNIDGVVFENSMPIGLFSINYAGDAISENFLDKVPEYTAEEWNKLPADMKGVGTIAIVQGATAATDKIILITTNGAKEIPTMAQLEELEQRVTETEDDIASLKTESDSAELRITETENDIAAIKSEADSAELRITEAEDDITKLKTDMDSVGTGLSDLHNDMIIAQADITENSARITSNKNSIDDLTNLVQGIENSWVGNKTFSGSNPASPEIDVKTLTGDKGAFTFGAGEKLVAKVKIDGTTLSDEQQVRVGYHSDFHIVGRATDGSVTADVTFTLSLNTNGTLRMTNFHSTGATNYNAFMLRLTLLEQNAKTAAVLQTKTIVIGADDGTTTTGKILV